MDQAKSGLVSGVAGVIMVGVFVMVAATQCQKRGNVEPSPGVTVTVPRGKSPSPVASVKPSATGAIEEWPDCGYALPTCVRQEGETWYVIGDYEGDKHPVTLIRSEVRGSVLYRFVRAS